MARLGRSGRSGRRGTWRHPPSFPRLSDCTACFSLQVRFDNLIVFVVASLPGGDRSQRLANLTVLVVASLPGEDRSQRLAMFPNLPRSSFLEAQK